MPQAAVYADGAPAPGVPTEAGLVVGLGVSCATDESAPGIADSPQPYLTARVHGEADASQSQNLRAHFTVDRRNTDGSWTPVSTRLAPSTGFVRDDMVVTTRLVTELSPDTMYRMSAATWSYAADQIQYTASAATAFCYFTMDPTAPLPPEIIYGGPYTECTAEDCVGRGGANVPGTFTFAPAEGDSPVVGYRYRFSTDSTVKTASGSTVTITFTPPYRTLVNLYVAARDELGRYGPDTITSFKVA